MNINTYIDCYGDKTFEERPLNEVDSLIFAELSYLHFDKFVGNEKPEKSLKELVQYADELVTNTYFPKSNRHLIEKCAASMRFKDIRIGWFVQRYDEELTLQFAALTFKMGDGTAVVTFRGTDLTIVGWKEDFNMAFLSEIPAQSLAVEYLAAVAAAESGKLYICGHSKGGNLSVYSAVFGAPETRERIVGIYNHDGPGFNESIFTKPEYIELEGRMHKAVPHDSLIGILLEHTSDYKVVPCKSVSIGQHNPFVWEVMNENSFEEKPKTSLNSRIIDKALYDFVNGMNDEQRKMFVHGLFTVIEGSGAKHLAELKTDVLKRMAGMTKAYLGLTGEVKKLMALGGMKFAKLWFQTVVNFTDEA